MEDARNFFIYGWSKKTLKMNIHICVWERSSILKVLNSDSSNFYCKELYHTIDEVESLFGWKDYWGNTEWFFCNRLKFLFQDRIHKHHKWQINRWIDIEKLKSIEQKRNNKYFLHL